MSRIPLRTYNQEIEEAIEHKQFEEAISHCHHILKTFPKHIDTYRLLGKAYLESHRYNNALDIFQRVLSSIPTDFISHIGMSIIKENEGNLNASIWHMERAFESQPYNTAIQAELKRLYGLRDGIEPPKIRMTRGALARMYAKGDLYEQAIAEIRATLSSDPDRSDLQVLLADMYAKNGQESEAIQTCGSILQKLPYCLEANLLLTELIPEEEGSDEIRTCRQRIQSIDPYTAFISPKTPTPRDVPDQAVTLPRLDWDGDSILEGSKDQPQWAKDIRERVEEIDSEREDIPKWLMDEDDESIKAVDEILGQEPGQIPDWLQDAGWRPSDGSSVERTIEYFSDLEESDIEEAVIGEVPVWLQSIAPDDFSVGVKKVFNEIDSSNLEEAMPEWLDDEEVTSSESMEEWLQVQEDTEELPEEPSGLIEKHVEERLISEEESPEWLGELAAEEAELEDISESLKKHEPEIPTESIEVSESIVKIESDQMITEEEGITPSEIPDWLQELETEREGDAEILTPSDEEIISEAEPAAEAKIPEWLLEFEAEQEIAEEAETTRILETSLEEEGAAPSEIPDWLQELEAEREVEAEMLPPSEEEMATEGEPAAEAEIPGWLLEFEAEQEIDEEAETTKIPEMASEGEPAAEAEIPEWLLEFEAEQEPAEEAETTRIPETTSEEEGAAPSDIPDWLQELETEREVEVELVTPTEEEFVSEGEPAAEAEISEWLLELEAEQEIAEEADTTRILETSLEEEGAAPSDIPDWLQELETEREVEVELVTPTEEEFVSEGEPAAEAEIPGWLLEFEAEQEIAEEAETTKIPETSLEEEGAASSEIPDWLQELETEEEIEVGKVQSFEEEIPFEDEEPTEAGIPEWLLTPQAVDSEGKFKSEQFSELSFEEADKSEQEIPDWLRELETEKSEIDHDFVEKIGVDEEPADEDTVSSEWIEVTSEILSEETSTNGITAWLAELDEDKFSEAEVDHDTAELPQWLEDLAEIEKEAEIDSDIPPYEAISEVADMESPEFSDIDEAMQWLEDLAEKPSISDDELISKPLEEPDDSFVGIAQITETAMEQNGEMEDVAITPAELFNVVAEPQDSQIREEELIGEGELEVTGDEQIPQEVEIPTDREMKIPDIERLEEIEIEGDEVFSDSLADTQPTTPIEEETFPPIEVEDILEIEDEVEIESLVELVEEEEFISEDLAETEPPEVELEYDQIEATDQAEPEQIYMEDEIQPPAWVLEETEPPDEDYKWLPADMQEPVSSDDLLDLNEASLIQLERLPSLGFRAAQAIVVYRQKHGLFNNLDDLINVPGLEETTINSLKDEVKIIPAVVAEESISERVPPGSIFEEEKSKEDFGLPELTKLSEDEFTIIIEEYSSLIEKGERLDDVIEEMKEALYEDYSNEMYVEIFQVLGDAYAKADRLQEALDAYSKAEELLR